MACSYSKTQQAMMLAFNKVYRLNICPPNLTFIVVMSSMFTLFHSIIFLIGMPFLCDCINWLLYPVVIPKPFLPKRSVNAHPIQAHQIVWRFLFIRKLILVQTVRRRRNNEAIKFGTYMSIFCNFSINIYRRFANLFLFHIWEIKSTHFKL